ncbi:DNA-binding protein [Seleniivibrio woodruffii]|uniref:helix-turn-helix domain-containing transcriptional regulator n=1 Tax=Seleniivibrio woodruffii TaxID=1078050 RepID=UPI0039E273A4
MRRARTLDEIIQSELKDEDSRNEYVRCAVEDFFENGDEIELLLAIRQVAIAGEGLSVLSAKIGISEDVLGSILTGKEDISLETFRKILSALGFSLKLICNIQ